MFNSHQGRPALIGLFSHTPARLYIKIGAASRAKALAVLPAQLFPGEFAVNCSGDNTGQIHLLSARREYQYALLIGIKVGMYFTDQPNLKGALHGTGGLANAAVTDEGKIGPHHATQEEIHPPLVCREFHLNRRIRIPQIIDADV